MARGVSGLSFLSEVGVNSWWALENPVLLDFQLPIYHDQVSGGPFQSGLTVSEEGKLGFKSSLHQVNQFLSALVSLPVE